jgi:hypothetical protein
MAVRISGNPWVLHPTVRVQVHFCTCDPNTNPTHAELGLGAGFVFHPQVHPKFKKKP